LGWVRLGGPVLVFHPSHYTTHHAGVCLWLGLVWFGPVWFGPGVWGIVRYINRGHTSCNEGGLILGGVNSRSSLLEQVWVRKAWNGGVGMMGMDGIGKCRDGDI
jgi:hypothetical protein